MNTPATTTGTEVEKKPNKNPIIDFMERPDVKKRLDEVLKENATAFATSLIQLVNSNNSLIECQPSSILNSALVATTLNLPINNQLGLAYVVPFKERQKDNTYITKAQLQIGYRGFIKLANNTGQIEKINATDVREGEIKNFDRLSGDIEFDWIQDFDEREKKNIVGYVAFYRLFNGQSKTLYMSKTQIEKHAKKYSQTFKKYNSGLWTTEFDEMAKKTVIKQLLSKNALLSIEDKNMQKAIISDQVSIKDYNGDTIDAEYVDNQPITIEVSAEEKQSAFFKESLDQVLTLEELNSMVESGGNFSDEELALIEEKRKELTNARK